MNGSNQLSVCKCMIQCVFYYCPMSEPKRGSRRRSRGHVARKPRRRPWGHRAPSARRWRVVQSPERTGVGWGAWWGHHRAASGLAAGALYTAWPLRLVAKITLLPTPEVQPPDSLTDGRHGPMRAP